MTAERHVVLEIRGEYRSIRHEIRKVRATRSGGIPQDVENEGRVLKACLQERQAREFLRGLRVHAVIAIRRGDEIRYVVKTVSADTGETDGQEPRGGRIVARFEEKRQAKEHAKLLTARRESSTMKRG